MLFSVLQCVLHTTSESISPCTSYMMAHQVVQEVSVTACVDTCISTYSGTYFMPRISTHTECIPCMSRTRSVLHIIHDGPSGCPGCAQDAVHTRVHKCTLRVTRRFKYAKKALFGLKRRHFDTSSGILHIALCAYPGSFWHSFWACTWTT